MKENKCNDCGNNMNDKWPNIVHLLKICPDCVSKKDYPRYTYKMFGRNKAPSL